MTDPNPLASLADPVRQLSGWLQPTDITRLELTGPDTRITLQRQGARWAQAESPALTAAAADAATSTPGTHTAVRAGSVGVLHLRQPGREHDLVATGQAVVKDQPLALLQIGLVLVPVLAPRAGVVQSIEATQGATVGYGNLLFQLT